MARGSEQTEVVSIGVGEVDPGRTFFLPGRERHRASVPAPARRADRHHAQVGWTGQHAAGATVRVDRRDPPEEPAELGSFLRRQQFEFDKADQRTRGQGRGARPRCADEAENDEDE